MKIELWPINEVLKEEANKHYRTSFALALKDKNPWEIVSQLTFDSVAPNLNFSQVKKLFSWVDGKILKKNQVSLSGVGLELGSGAGFMSAVIADRDGVGKIYAVEVVENIVRELGPKITDFVLGGQSDKVVGCVGEFDNLQLADNSVDFAFDFYSLHHSPNLIKTLKEVARVLKPGGFVLCFDKTRDNKLTRDDLEKLLDQEYSRDSKILMGLPPDLSHTRRQNGEREYRLKDWEEAFMASGFSSTIHYHLARISGKRAGKLLKEIISFLPINWQIKITKHWYKNKKVNNLEISNLVFCPPIKNFPKEISLLIAKK